MKAEELRIRNYINSKRYGDEQINSYQINELFNYQNGGIVAEYYHDIKPIELTEKWLIKFGFEINHNGMFEKNIIRMDKTLSDFNARLILSRDTSLLLNITKYVHQLQNLYFALTGEELEIKI